MKKFLLACAVIAVICLPACAAQKYIVTGRLAPIFEDAKSAKPAPKGGWMMYEDEVAGMLAYGDVIEGSPAKNKKGWLSRTGENKGFVEMSLLSPMPKFEAFKARPFQVLNGGIVPCLLPGERPVSEYSKFTLPRGGVEP